MSSDLDRGPVPRVSPQRVSGAGGRGGDQASESAAAGELERLIGALVGLDAAATETQHVVGGKAFRLARAARLGLPVLPGFVVPIPTTRMLTERALGALEREGPHAAYLCVMSQGVGPTLGRLLVAAARQLGGLVVVRSSAPVEGDARWAGAFSSFVGIQPDEVPTAVAGCCASVFRPDVVSRCRAEGLSPHEVSPAVLVQSLVVPRVSGVARLEPDGSVDVVVVRGAPATLLSGLVPGVPARIEASGEVIGGATEVADRKVLEEVAALVRSLDDGGGPILVEWAHTGERLLLLQTGTAAPLVRLPAGPPSGGATLGSDGPAALRVAQRVARYAGPLGEAMVLPWLLGPEAVTIEELGPAFPTSPEDAMAAWRRARALARQLIASAWSRLPAQAAVDAAAALRGLAGSSPRESLWSLAGLNSVDPTVAIETLGLLRTVGLTLQELGAVFKPEELWALEPDQVPRLLNSRGPSRIVRGSRAILRWQGFLYAAVTATGRSVEGDPASPGIATGVPRLVNRYEDLATVVPGEIVVLLRPLPHFAPVLWVAGGLVIRRAGTGAHLVEVARSLRVPAVVGVGAELSPALESCLLAVDGHRGVVTVAP